MMYLPWNLTLKNDTNESHSSCLTSYHQCYKYEEQEKILAPLCEFQNKNLLFDAGGTEEFTLGLEKVLPSLPPHKAHHEQRVFFAFWSLYSPVKK